MAGELRNGELMVVLHNFKQGISDGSRGTQWTKLRYGIEWYVSIHKREDHLWESRPKHDQWNLAQHTMGGLAGGDVATGCA